MKEITSHKVNGLNESITIRATDEPGAGGAHHNYEIEFGPTSDQVVKINFQNGPIKEAGVNGVSNEALLAIVRDRLEGFVNGPFTSKDNADALWHVEQAMEKLHKRTLDRLDRGVEGTMAK